jgi:hypothetical protein
VSTVSPPLLPSWLRLPSIPSVSWRRDAPGSVSSEWRVGVNPLSHSGDLRADGTTFDRHCLGNTTFASAKTSRTSSETYKTLPTNLGPSNRQLNFFVSFWTVTRWSLLNYSPSPFFLNHWVDNLHWDPCTWPLYPRFELHVSLWPQDIYSTQFTVSVREITVSAQLHIMSSIRCRTAATTLYTTMCFSVTFALCWVQSLVFTIYDLEYSMRYLRTHMWTISSRL